MRSVLASMAPLWMIGTLSAAAIANVAAGVHDTPNAKAEVEATDAMPPALAQLASNEGRISWRGIAPGMLLRDVSSSLGLQLRTDRPIGSGCGGEGLDVVVDGTWLLLAFTGAERSAELHTLLIRVEEGAERETLIDALKRRVGELRYLGASPEDEIADPTPTYAAGRPEVVLRVEPGRGIRFTVPQCLD